MAYGSSDDASNNTKIIAGEETGGADNGYSQWDHVYVQYDFEKEVPVHTVNIYRNTYENAISTFKDVKVELSTSEDFSPETTRVIFEQADVEETVINKGNHKLFNSCHRLMHVICVFGDGALYPKYKQFLEGI